MLKLFVNDSLHFIDNYVGNYPDNYNIQGSNKKLFYIKIMPEALH